MLSRGNSEQKNLMHTQLATSLFRKLQELADTAIKSWWEGYVKDSAPFLGVKMAAIRSCVHQWYNDQVSGELEVDEQLELALQLLRRSYSEEKLAGTLMLQEILIPLDVVSCSPTLPKFADLFSDGYIYDWNICDWFSVKVLGPLIIKDGRICAESISAWRSAENLWQARASLVAFIPLAEKVQYYPLIEQSCRVLIRRDERFSKTAVGWLLRDISRYDANYVKRLITENITHFSAESLNNATKYFSKAERKEYRQKRLDDQPK